MSILNIPTIRNWPVDYRISIMIHTGGRDFKLFHLVAIHVQTAAIVVCAAVLSQRLGRGRRRWAARRQRAVRGRDRRLVIPGVNRLKRM